MVVVCSTAPLAAAAFRELVLRVGVVKQDQVVETDRTRFACGTGSKLLVAIVGLY